MYRVHKSGKNWLAKEIPDNNAREIIDEIEPYLNDGEPVILVESIDDLGMWDIDSSSVQIVEDNE